MAKSKSNTMFKEDLSRMVAQNMNITIGEAKTVINNVFGAIIECLMEGQNVKIVGFGTFTVRRCAAKRSTNPRTHEDIVVPPQNRLGIKYATNISESIRYNPKITDILDKAAEIDKAR